MHSSSSKAASAQSCISGAYGNSGGIDVGAKYEIYELILQLAKQGKAVMMVSSEMPELIGICDRILVMSNGHMAGILERGKDFGGIENEQETIMRLAAQYV